MRIDPEEFSRHYATLSDDALLDINPSDLVDIARERWAMELRNRRLALDGDDAEPDAESVDLTADAEPLETIEGWEDNAICACTFTQNSASDSPSTSAEIARDALAAAGVPGYIESESADDSSSGRPECRVMIPAQHRLLAESVLDKEIFNASIEADWAAHFEDLDDEQLLALTPEKLCAGILDRAARLKKALNSELAHRGITK